METDCSSHGILYQFLEKISPREKFFVCGWMKFYWIIKIFRRRLIWFPSIWISVWVIIPKESRRKKSRKFNSKMMCLCSLCIVIDKVFCWFISESHPLRDQQSLERLENIEKGTKLICRKKGNEDVKTRIIIMISRWTQQVSNAITRKSEVNRNAARVIESEIDLFRLIDAHRWQFSVRNLLISSMNFKDLFAASLLLKLFTFQFLLIICVLHPLGDFGEGL